MSTAELIRQVKALPVRERQKFVLAILPLIEDTPLSSGNEKRRVNWPDVEARAKRIFCDCILPNVVLLEREAFPSLNSNKYRVAFTT